MSTFIDLLKTRWAQGKFLCIGLDPKWDDVPPDYRGNTQQAHTNAWSCINAWLKDVADTTAEFAAAFKPNLSFYEGMSEETGMVALRHLLRHLKNRYPDIPVILDWKRGDIGKTNGALVDALGRYRPDASTIHPYLGLEANRPFLDEKDRGVVVLAQTSNPGASEFQGETLNIGYGKLRTLLREGLKLEQVASNLGWEAGNHPNHYAVPVCEYVALRVSSSNGWNYNGNTAVVVGATKSEQLGRIRYLVGDEYPILAPGYGAQGAKLGDIVPQLMPNMASGTLINSSSGITAAYLKSDETDEPVTAARQAAQLAHDEILRLSPC